MACGTGEGEGEGEAVTTGVAGDVIYWRERRGREWSGVERREEGEGRVDFFNKMHAILIPTCTLNIVEDSNKPTCLVTDRLEQ